MTDPESAQRARRELRKLLARLYPLEADQRRLVEEAGLDVGVIPLNSSAYNNWHQILHYAGNNLSVERLIAHALEEHPDNPPLRAFAEGRPAALLEGDSFEWHGPSKAKPMLEQLLRNKASLVDVTHLAIGLERARSVAKIVREDGGTGTGFLIHGDRLVTNHHVLPNAELAASATAIFNYQKTLPGQSTPQETQPLNPSLFFRTSPEDDWTVVAVAGNPGARWGELELRPLLVQRGDPVNIVQHPGGGPKQIALSFDVVAYVGASRVQYLTDTLPGSSGAPVFDRNWNVVALHHSGGWLSEPDSPDRRVYYRNQGIAIGCLIEGLRE